MGESVSDIMDRASGKMIYSSGPCIVGYFSISPAIYLEFSACCAEAHSGMGKTPGALNKGNTRASLMDLIEKSGLDFKALCRTEGENIAQPTKSFLEKIVNKYGLATSPAMAAPNKEGGVKNFFSKSGQNSTRDTPCPNITNIGDSPDNMEPVANSDEEDDALDLVQPNQVLGRFIK